VTFLDTNVLLDLFCRDPAWEGWSTARLAERSRRGALCINDVVWAELSVGFPDAQALDAALKALGVLALRTPPAALFLAGRAHAAYRQRGGTRTGVLADFFIGAQAAAADVPLLTRDPRRYRVYFPDLTLITP
jgi:predicted nucleic acid-binding protein